MAFEKKTWKNRQSEFPTRRTLTPVAGETNVYDVTRSEGAIAEPGDAFNDSNMNDLENRIETGFNSIDVGIGYDVISIWDLAVGESTSFKRDDDVTSASSSDSTKASVTFDGKVVTITGVGAGSCTITIDGTDTIDVSVVSA